MSDDRKYRMSVAATTIEKAPLVDIQRDVGQIEIEEALAALMKAQRLLTVATSRAKTAKGSVGKSLESVQVGRAIIEDVASKSSGNKQAARAKEAAGGLVSNLELQTVRTHTLTGLGQLATQAGKLIEAVQAYVSPVELARTEAAEAVKLGATIATQANQYRA